MTNLLDDILERFSALPGEVQQQIARDAIKATAGRQWVPNPGPQTSAVLTQADQLFYGGQAGGGKTDLICGLALTDHKQSLLLRRTDKDTLGLEERLAEIVGDRDGYNGQKKLWRRPNGRMIEIGGCQYEGDKQKYKGRPHDLIAFDEIADFTETQFRFIIGWNRSADKTQRCRVICSGNPPTTPEGLWVLKYWAPWLDDTHPNPAKDGELRWFTTIGGQDVECDGPDPVEVDGEMIQPLSRTFIRSELSDNPDLAATNYGSVLAALPEELRAAYKDGSFNVLQKDNAFQVIPTEWIKAAQARWSPEKPKGVGMTVLSHDVALGGGDANTYAPRYGHWYDEIISERLTGFVDPINLAAKTVSLMRDGCEVVVDMGGGYGSGVYSHLKNNVSGIVLHAHNGANSSSKRTRDGKLKFANKRAEVYWKFREALEPGLGEPVALPPDPELLADLSAPTWSLGSNGIQIEKKEDIKKRIGRSPDKGDSVVNGWSYGESSVSVRIRTHNNPHSRPVVNLGHANMKRRR